MIDREAIVYLFRESRGSWCVLHTACLGGWVTTLCGGRQPYGPILVFTEDPGDSLCRACRAELAADTRGARDEEDGLGPDSEAIRAALAEHEDLLDEPSAFDHLRDLRELDE